MGFFDFLNLTVELRSTKTHLVTSLWWHRLYTVCDMNQKYLSCSLKKKQKCFIYQRETLDLKYDFLFFTTSYITQSNLNHCLLKNMKPGSFERRYVSRLAAFKAQFFLQDFKTAFPPMVYKVEASKLKDWATWVQSINPTALFPPQWPLPLLAWNKVPIVPMPSFSLQNQHPFKDFPVPTPANLNLKLVTSSHNWKSAYIWIHFICQTPLI